ncbi:hypothetical protein AURDEDRAFT_115926 [Auricularia subglabra TFB-10046 SS5]|nr:hypothetical protein AURDEDRAFT_115926 [Auricularia subglabra TFB-10046 SS5]
MALPSDHRVTTLSIDGPPGGWLAANKKLRLVANFAGISSLDLRGFAMESTSIFASAVAQFPLLRKVTLFGITITDQNFSSGIQAPCFAQPCDLRVLRLEPSTWDEICRWALLDLSRFGGMFLNLVKPEVFVTEFVPGHPEIGPHVRDVEAQYMGSDQEDWPNTDVSMQSFTGLSILRLLSSSRLCVNATLADVALVKLAEVAQHQTTIAPDLRDLIVNVMEFRPRPPYGRDRLERLVSELAQLVPRVRVCITFQWFSSERYTGAAKQSLDEFFESFTAWCRLKFPSVEWMKYGYLIVSTGGSILLL